MDNPVFESQYTAEQIESSIGKYPRINPATYRWEVWDVLAGTYVDTGVSAYTGLEPAIDQAEAAAAAAAESAAQAQVQAGMAYQIATSAADMTDQSIGYVYVGSESGYTYGGWYYWDGTAWTLGGTDVDATLTVAGAAADAKATGEVIGETKSDLRKLNLIDINHLDLHNGRINSAGKWVDIDDNNKFVVLPINGGESYKITINNSQNFFYAVLRSYTTPVSGEYADFSAAEGYTGVVSTGQVSSGTFPADGRFLLLMIYASGVDKMPKSLLIDGYDYAKSVQEHIAAIPAVDPTLSVAGAAADAKATGTALANHEELLSTLFLAPTNCILEIGGINANGTLSPTTTRIRSLPVVVDGTYNISFLSDNSAYRYYVYYYNADGTFADSTNPKRLSEPTIVPFEDHYGSFRLLFRYADGTVEMTETDLNYLHSLLVVQNTTSKLDRALITLTPEAFGAKGDGVTDDTVAIQLALDSVPDGGGKVELTPNKSYRITSMLRITKSGTTFDGNGAIIKSEIASGFMLVACGSVGVESNLRVNIYATDGNESLISILHEGPIAFNNGDALILQSQRDALSTDSGLYWCGTPTGGTLTAHWAEPLTVNQPVNTRKVKCTGTLIYPYYYANRESGVDVSTTPVVREHSTIRKADFLKNVIIRNMTFLAYGGSSHNDNTIGLVWCRDSAFEGVTVRKLGATSHGRCFVLQNCWACRFDGCVADATAVYHENVDVVHVYDNHFTFSSCWHCRADECYSYHAGQSFDTTYAAIYTESGLAFVRCPSVDITITECTVHGSTDNAATNHSGAWGVTYSDCSFTNCAKGMLIRSPHTIVSGCTFMCNTDPAHNASEFAIYLSEPTTFQSLVIGNTIIGGRGIRVNPYVNRSTAPDNLLSVLGISIVDNMFQDTRGGIYIERYSEWAQSDDMCIGVRGNVFRGTKQRPVIELARSNCNGIDIVGNVMIGCSTLDDYNALIYTNGSQNILVAQNKAVLCNKPIEPV